MPLGPFNNIYGMGASPVIVGDLLVLACDQSLGSYVMALDKRTGKVRGRSIGPRRRAATRRRSCGSGPDGKDQILLPGSFLLTSYDAATGKKLWWVGGLSFEMKSTPVIGGDTIYVNGYGAPVNDPGNKVIDPAGRRGVEDRRCRRQRHDLEDRVPEVHAGVLVRRDRPRRQRRRSPRTSGPTTARRSTPRTACSPSASAARAT